MSDAHILQKLGILRSFQIVKFISDTELKNIENGLKHLPKKQREEEFEKIVGDIEEQSRTQPIPGLLFDISKKGNKIKKAKRTEKLMNESIKLAKLISNLSKDKSEQSFIIASLTKLLELKIKNFNEWKESQKDDDEDND